MARFFQDLSMERKSEEEENNVLISVSKDCVTNKSSNVIKKIVHAKITRIFLKEKTRASKKNN